MNRTEARALRAEAVARVRGAHRPTAAILAELRRGAGRAATDPDATPAPPADPGVPTPEPSTPEPSPPDPSTPEPSTPTPDPSVPTPDPVPPTPEPSPMPGPEPTPEPVVPPEPAPPGPGPVAPDQPPPAPTMADLLREAVETGPADDLDDTALTLAFALQSALAAEAARGADAAVAAGVPAGDAGDGGLDTVPDLVRPIADELLLGRRDAALALVPPVAARLARAARATGTARVTFATQGWVLVQRFGEPYCPASTCFGHDGRRLSADDVARVGLPPYADECNCRVEPARSAS